ncbi:T5orf172 domain-containing protein [Faustovirus]|nr:T5orf172 domain-containing protein [Faustovirus]
MEQHTEAPIVDPILEPVIDQQPAPKLPEKVIKTPLGDIPNDAPPTAGIFYIVTTSDRMINNQYKLGKCTGTQRKLLSRYKTPLINPICVLFYPIKSDVIAFERTMLNALQQYIINDENDNPTEWVKCNVSEILNIFAKHIPDFDAAGVKERVKRERKNAKNDRKTAREKVKTMTEQMDEIKFNMCLEKHLSATTPEELAQTLDITIRDYMEIKAKIMQPREKKKRALDDAEINFQIRPLLRQELRIRYNYWGEMNPDIIRRMLQSRALSTTQCWNIINGLLADTTAGMLNINSEIVRELRDKKAQTAIKHEIEYYDCKINMHLRVAFILALFAELGDIYNGVFVITSLSEATVMTAVEYYINQFRNDETRANFKRMFDYSADTVLLNLTREDAKFSAKLSSINSILDKIGIKILTNKLSAGDKRAGKPKYRLELNQIAPVIPRGYRLVVEN